MFAAVGIAGSAGIMCGVIAVVSVLPIILLQWRGHGWRERKMARVENANVTPQM